MTSPFTDSFNRADGPIANGWAASTWSISANAANNTPIPGGELITNGSMEAPNPLAAWVAAHSAAVTAVADERTGGAGAQSTSVVNGVNASGGGLYQQAIAPLNSWILVEGWLKKVTADVRITLRDSAWETIINSPTVTALTWTHQLLTTRLLTANCYLYPQNILATAGLESHVDDLSLKIYPFSDLVALRPARDLLPAPAPVIGGELLPTSYRPTPATSQVKIAAYIPNTQTGLIHNLDDPLDPQNFLLVYYDGVSIAVRTCIAGVYVNRAKDAVAWGAGKLLEIVTDGDTVQVWYDGVRIGPAQYLPELSAGPYYGMFSTYPGNLLEDYALFDTTPADYSTRIRGIDLRNDVRGTWGSTKLKGWMARMPGFGVEWIVLNTLWYQTNIDSTVVYEHATKTPTNAELGTFIDYLHGLGFKVALKPLLNLAADPTHGRNKIGFNFVEADFIAWFASYQIRMLDYAQLAQDHAVDLYVIGTEFTCLEPREADWRALVAEIKTIYTGLLTYASDRVGYTVVAWWDLMDYLAIDAYFIIHDHISPTLQEVIEGWAVKRLLLDAWSKAEGNKPILFTEVGYSAALGTAMEPYRYLWDEVNDIDWLEQNTCYQALLEIFRPCAWLAGMFLWELESFYVYGGWDVKFSPFGKYAGQTLKSFWGGDPAVFPAPDPHIGYPGAYASPDRTCIVDPEPRVNCPPLENRFLTCPYESRTLSIPPEPRTLEVPPP